MPAGHRPRRPRVQRRASRQPVPGPKSAAPAVPAPRAAPWWFAVLVCAVLAVYANTLRNGFVWDDGNIIVSNPMVRHWTEAARLFTSSLERNTQYYRPVLGLS